MWPSALLWSLDSFIDEKHVSRPRGIAQQIISFKLRRACSSSGTSQETLWIFTERHTNISRVVFEILMTSVCLHACASLFTLSLSVISQSLPEFRTTLCLITQILKGCQALEGRFLPNPRAHSFGTADHQNQTSPADTFHQLAQRTVQDLQTTSFSGD
jgi:hypothetical protein